MSCKLLILISCFGIFIQVTSLPAMTPRREEEMRTKFYLAGGFAFDIRKLTKEERYFLANLAHEQIPKDIYEGGGTSLDTLANQTLVLLGEKETTQRFLARYRKTGRNAEPLVRSYDPKVIQALSADLFQADPWPIPPSKADDDQPVMPPSYRVCSVIGMILEGAPAFSERMNEWAIRNFKYNPQKGFVSPYDERRVLRKWWKQNERFFKSGDYKSVEPGEELFAKPTTIAPNSGK